MSDLFGNHIVGFPMRRLIDLKVNIYTERTNGPLYEPRREKTIFQRFLTRLDINQAVQALKTARSWGYRRIGLCRENNGAD